MSLPSSRRPAYAQQLLEEEGKEAKKIKLKLKINKSDAVISSIGSWYLSLPSKARRKLTPKRFKRRVLKSCFDLSFNYDNLPLTWVDTLKEKYGLVLVEKKKKIAPEGRKQSYPAYMEDEFDTEDEDEDVPDGVSFNVSKQSFREELQELFSSGGSNHPVPMNGTATPGTIHETSDDEVLRETRATFRKRFSSAQTTVSGDEESPKETLRVQDAERKKKRLVDLTNEPPPLTWLAAAARGRILPRIMRIYSSNDVNVVFYDYEPTKAEFPTGSVVKNFTGNGFQWWIEEIRHQVRTGTLRKETPTDEP